MKPKPRAYALYFLLTLTLSCTNNRCSPTAPDEAVHAAPPEIAYHRADHGNTALHDKLHVMNVETDSYRVIGDLDKGSPIVWRTQKSEIVHIYTTPSGSEQYLLVSKVDGSASTMLATLSSLFPSAVKSLSLSPNQDSIAVASGDDGFYLFKMDTTDVYTKVGTGKALQVEFSPRVKKLALLIADSTAVYLVNTSGKIEERFGLDFFPEQLQWSPNGNKIACWNEKAEAAIMEIANMKVSGYSNLRDISWSPNSEEIMFSDSHTNLGKMNADGSNRVLLGTTGTHTQWSPSGNYLAFCEPNGNEKLLIVSGAKGGNKKQIAMLSSPSFAWRPL